MKSYKIEKKPIFWNVVLSHGSYSDYEEEHYCIAANSKEEAQLFFKQYWDEAHKNVKKEKEYNECYAPCLVFEDDEKYIPSSRTKKSNKEIDWSTDYGDANDVRISMLGVIHIQKLNSNK